jgi:hypothetical protein
MLCKEKFKVKLRKESIRAVCKSRICDRQRYPFERLAVCLVDGRLSGRLIFPLLECGHNPT